LLAGKGLGDKGAAAYFQAAEDDDDEHKAISTAFSCPASAFFSQSTV
jgi:hypothetical protein